ncbi:hypothetical protein C7M84_000726 [Penaeus vannamei]|uniref:Uncharacterized protein n=1 Tax=Penaeus vannamei TaxID=6689 RepID=A0A3R7PAZ9_PENVA|nr:hypothetical protein C7M84_000726 [Penaeus vannamei]
MFFQLFHLCLLNLSIFPLPIVPCLPFTLFSPPLNLFSPAPRKIRRARLLLRIIRLDLSWPLLAVPRSRLQDLHDAPQSPSRISDSRGHSALSASVFAADLSPPRLLSNTYSPDSATSRGSVAVSALQFRRAFHGALPSLDSVHPRPLMYQPHKSCITHLEGFSSCFRKFLHKLKHASTPFSHPPPSPFPRFLLPPLPPISQGCTLSTSLSQYFPGLYSSTSSPYFLGLYSLPPIFLGLYSLPLPFPIFSGLYSLLPPSSFSLLLPLTLILFSLSSLFIPPLPPPSPLATPVFTTFLIPPSSNSLLLPRSLYQLFFHSSFLLPPSPTPFSFPLLFLFSLLPPSLFFPYPHLPSPLSSYTPSPRPPSLPHSYLLPSPHPHSLPPTSSLAPFPPTSLTPFHPPPSLPPPTSLTPFLHLPHPSPTLPSLLSPHFSPLTSPLPPPSLTPHPPPPSLPSTNLLTPIPPPPSLPSSTKFDMWGGEGSSYRR